MPVQTRPHYHVPGARRPAAPVHAARPAVPGVPRLGGAKPKLRPRVPTIADVLREAQARYDKEVRIHSQAEVQAMRHRRRFAEYSADDGLGRWHFNWHQFDPTRSKRFKKFLHDLRHGRYQHQIWGGLGAIAGAAGAIVFGPAILAGAGHLFSSAGGAIGGLFKGVGGFLGKNLGKVSDLIGSVMGKSRDQGGGDVPPDTAAQVISQASADLGPSATVDQVQQLAAERLAQQYPAGSPQQQAEFARVPGMIMPAQQAFEEQEAAGVPPEEAAANVVNAHSATKTVEAASAGGNPIVMGVVIFGAAAAVLSLFMRKKH